MVAWTAWVPVLPDPSPPPTEEPSRAAGPTWAGQSVTTGQVSARQNLSPCLNTLRPRLSPSTLHRSALLSSDRWVCHCHLCGRWLSGDRKGLSMALMKELDLVFTHPAVTASRRLTRTLGQPYQGLTCTGFLSGLLKVSISLRTCP